MPKFLMQGILNGIPKINLLMLTSTPILSGSGRVTLTAVQSFSFPGALIGEGLAVTLSIRIGRSGSKPEMKDSILILLARKFLHLGRSFRTCSKKGWDGLHPQVETVWHNYLGHLHVFITLEYHLHRSTLCRTKESLYCRLLNWSYPRSLLGHADYDCQEPPTFLKVKMSCKLDSPS